MARYHAYDELDDTAAKSSKGTRARRASLLGFMAVLIGLAAVAVSQRDRLNEGMNQRGWPYAGYLYEVKEYKVDPYHVAAAGAGVAVLALLLRKVTGRTRGGWPVLAILLCAGAAGTYRYEHSPKDAGSPERWVKDNVVDRVGGWINKTPAQPQPPAVTSTPTPQPTPGGEPVSTPATSSETALTPPSAPRSDRPATKPSNNIFGL